jgi:hypothetical protein
MKERGHLENVGVDGKIVQVGPKEMGWEGFDWINPLKTECVCLIQRFSAYRAGNTLHFGYKNQSLNVL